VGSNREKKQSREAGMKTGQMIAVASGGGKKGRVSEPSTGPETTG